MKHDSKNNNKNTTKKVIALGAALSVIAGIGTTALNNSQEAQAKGINSKTSIINKSKEGKSKKISSTKRPSTNIEKSSGEINLRTESGGGRKPSSPSENKRKAVTKVVNKINSDSTDETNTENSSKRPDKKYSSIDEKKQKSKTLAKSSNTSNSTNSVTSSNKIVIKVSTKK